MDRRGRRHQVNQIVLAAAGLALLALVTYLVAGWARNRQPAASLPEAVIYLSPAGAGELYTLIPDGQPQRLTDTAGQVVDYAPSHASGQVVYSAANPDGSASLWLIDRAGGKPRRLFACEAARCLRPAWSPDGQRIAFTHWGVNANGEMDPLAYIWTVQAGGKDPAPLYREPQVAGDGAFWSPDGSRLAFYDVERNGTRVIDLASNQETLIEGEQTQAAAWSPDGRYLFYASTAVGADTFRAPIYRYDFTSRSAELFLGGPDSDEAFNLPAWSPDGQWLAVGIRPLGGVPSQQVWIMRVDGSERQQVTNDPTYFHGAYRWDAGGQGLVMQRIQLGSSDSAPEVALWQRADSAPQVLAENAAQPGWLH